MAGFGGAVKLTGESEYRNALKTITQSLKEVSAQMKLTSTEYDKNDKSAKALSAQSTNLAQKLDLQKAKVTQLQNQYASMAKQYDDNTKKHNALVNEYNKEKTKLDEIGKAYGTTSAEYKKQEKVVNDLAKEVTKSSNAQEKNAKAMSDMRIQIANAQGDVNKTAKEIDNLGKETEETTKDVKKAGDGFTVFKGVLSNLSTKAITTAISGLKKLGGAFISVGKQALESYAEYEQLVGGVETLFKDSAKEVEGYANQAYKTAGLSANKYMETVTSFSASLLQGLNGDTAKTAKIADMAIIDMADNANKMGTSMEMIQNAYQGFAKQNYTMLDNLKLGYGGTKTEMVRLINDSKILGKEIKNLDGITLDQIIQAIHKVQENMGITGTTAKEASSTIQGSVASMKSAWQNLLTGIADENQDFGKLVDNFVDSVITAGENIIPRVKKIVEGIKKMLNSLTTQVFPKLKKEIPELKPIINVFEWFIKNREKVVTAVKLMVGAFAVAKIVSFTKGLNDTVTAIMNSIIQLRLAKLAKQEDTTAEVANTTAKVAGKTATEALTAKQATLNAVMGANPIGLVVIALTAMVAVMKLATKESEKMLDVEKENYSEIQSVTQAVNDNKQAWEDLAKTKQNSVDAGMTELSHYQDLYKELDNIVDANGRVKEGYEARASFITTTLRDALGIELEMNGNQVKGMQNLRDSIQEVIDKKKAQIILDSQEPMYTEAITKRTEAVDKLTELENKLADERKRADVVNADVEKAEQKLNRARAIGGIGMQVIASNELKHAKERRDTYNKGVQDLENSIKAQEDLIGQYAYTKQQYETNMVLASQGAYDQMSDIEWKYVQNVGDATDAEKAMLEAKVKNTEKNIETLKKVRTDANAKEIDAEIAKNEELLSEQQKALDDYVAKTTSTLKEDNGLWKQGLDQQLSIISGRKVEFRDAGNGQVQAYVDGEKIGAPKSKEEMAKIATTAINEIKSREGDAKTAGINIAVGVGNGIESESGSVFSKIRSFGARLLKNFKASLQEQSPSKATKEMGKFLMQGLGIGIEQEEKDVLRQVSNVGKDILSAFDTNLNSDSLNANLTAQIQSGLPTNLTANTSSIRQAQEEGYSYNNMVLAFQEALASMKIELDDEEAGRFVRKTVENAIYT